MKMRWRVKHLIKRLSLKWYKAYYKNFISIAIKLFTDVSLYNLANKYKHIGKHMKIDRPSSNQTCIVTCKNWQN